MGKLANKNFEDITWADLEAWAGPKIVSRGKSYQRSKYVSNLAITGSGELVAWVEGSSIYATMVSLDNGKISSVCTCPYHLDCKHAVAMVLEYLNCLENSRKVPKAGKKDQRLNLISQDIDEEDDDYDIIDDEIEREDMTSTKQGVSSSKTRLEDFLKKQSKSDLLKLIRGILEQHDKVREELEFSVRLKTASFPSLAKTVEREIEEAASEPGWWSYRQHRGYQPELPA